MNNVNLIGKIKGETKSIVQNNISYLTFPLEVKRKNYNGDTTEDYICVRTLMNKNEIFNLTDDEEYVVVSGYLASELNDKMEITKQYVFANKILAINEVNFYE